MTITTSKQLAEALGPKWEPQDRDAEMFHDSPEAVFRGVNVYVSTEGWHAHSVVVGNRKSPRAAVLALADKLEAEARALRESVRKEGP